jgi:hypothetical protein
LSWMLLINPLLLMIGKMLDDCPGYTCAAVVGKWL